MKEKVGLKRDLIYTKFKLDMYKQFLVRVKNNI